MIPSCYAPIPILTMSFAQVIVHI